MPNFTRLTAEFQIRVLARLITRMGPENAAWLARRVMRDRGTPRTQAFAAFSQQCVEAWKNRHYDVHLNGEAALLAALAPFKPSVLFDVGANIGDWSLAAAELVPNAHLHAFEITPATAEALAVNAAPFGARLTIHPFGLGDHEGEITVYLSPRDDTANSTLRDAVAISSDGNDDATIAEVAARITTGDAFLAEHGIAHLDFLKIDVEGAEFSVLSGFQNAFARNAIDLVQFEYGEINLKTRAEAGRCSEYDGISLDHLLRCRHRNMGERGSACLCSSCHQGFLRNKFGDLIQGNLRFINLTGTCGYRFGQFVDVP